MEHSIDLAACHFIQDVSPLSTQKIVKKLKYALKDVTIDDAVDLDALDAHLIAGGLIHMKVLRVKEMETKKF